MPEMSLLIMVVLLALTFDFINGFHDTANAIATCVSTRAIRPGVAIVGTAVLNFVGAMISMGVAKTIGGDIVMSLDLVNEMVIITGLVGAIIWNLLTWWFGMSSSSSHALIGGIIGSVLVSAGAAAMAFGMSVGGWKIIRTVGGKIFKMHPVHGFAADLNSAIVILSATLLHLPVSMTHVVSGSIMGVGSAQRVKAVHWDVARLMVVAWGMTIPCTAIMGGIAYLVLTAAFGGAL